MSEAKPGSLSSLESGNNDGVQPQQHKKRRGRGRVLYPRNRSNAERLHLPQRELLPVSAEEACRRAGVKLFRQYNFRMENNTLAAVQRELKRVAPNQTPCDPKQAELIRRGGLSAKVELRKWIAEGGRAAYTLIAVQDIKEDEPIGAVTGEWMILDEFELWVGSRNDLRHTWAWPISDIKGWNYKDFPAGMRNAQLNTEPGKKLRGKCERSLVLQTVEFSNETRYPQSFGALFFIFVANVSLKEVLGCHYARVNQARIIHRSVSYFRHPRAFSVLVLPGILLFRVHSHVDDIERWTQHFLVAIL